MGKHDLRHIDLQAMAQAGEAADYLVEDADLRALDQDELLGGTLRIRLTVRALQAYHYSLHLHAEGTVKVACDRCLAPVTLAIDADETYRVKHGDWEEGDAADLQYLSPRQHTYDALWDAYEVVCTSLPISRTHPPGECEDEMLARLQALSAEEEADDF